VEVAWGSIVPILFGFDDILVSFFPVSGLLLIGSGGAHWKMQKHATSTCQVQGESNIVVCELSW